MEVLKGTSILIGIVTAAEHDQIPSEIATKIDAVLNEKLDELFTSNALMQTARDNAEQDLSELITKHTALQSSHESMAGQVQAVAQLQLQLDTTAADLATVQSQYSALETEAARLRQERHLVADERDASTAMVARRDGEVARLQQDLRVMQEQLQREIETRCDAQAQLGDVESRILQLEYREKRVEQERALFNTQVTSLENQLTTRTDELLATRRDTSSRCVLLETRLATLRDEHAILQRQHEALEEQHTELVDRYTHAQQELCEDKRTAQQRLDAFQMELDAQRRLGDLFKEDAAAKAEHIAEMERALEEAKVRLDEAVERYGDLETSSKADRLAHDELTTKKTECIALLRRELQTANELLGSSGAATSVEGTTSPAAPRASKQFGGDKAAMSLTQVYNQYVDVSEHLSKEREENARLRGFLQTMMDELKEKAPLLARQRDDLEHAIATVEQLTQTQDEMTHEIDQLRAHCADQKRRCECDRLRVQLNDMGRQVCKLLQQRDLLTPDDDSTAAASGLSSQDIISKRLVTFSSVSELQQNNQRLLAVVRELSAKQEQLEHTEQLDHVHEQLERMREAHSDLLEQQQRQHKLTKMLTGQRDTYKTLYQQAVRSEQPVTQMERPAFDLVDGNSSMDGEDSHHSANQAADQQQQQFKDKAQQLEVELAKAQKQITQLTTETDTYRKEKSANEKALIEVNERLRQETQQLTGNNSALTATLNTTQLHLQTAKRNSDVLRKQLDPLEERVRVHSHAQAKLEASLTHHRDSLYEAMTKLSKSELALTQAQKDVAVLTEANERLLKERETFRQECQSSKVLHTNVALIKASLERTDAASRLRMEESLAEQQRECAALRRRLQEEQDHFRTLADDLQAKANAAKQRMEEERAAAERLRNDVAQMSTELQTKEEHVHTLQAAQTGSGLTVDSAVDVGKYRQVEQQLLERQSELDGLKQKLDLTKVALDQHTNVAEEASRQLTVLSEQYNTYRADTERQLEEQRAKIAELQEKCADLETELSLQRTDNLDEQEQMNRLQMRLTVATEQVAALTATVDTQSSELEQSRRTADDMSDKYSREVTLHSDDLRALTTLTAAMGTVQSELQDLRCKHSNLLDEHTQKEGGWKTRDEFLSKETAQLQQRFDDLIAQNSLLHDQIQQMNANMSVLQVQRTDATTHNVSLNRSLTEEDAKDSDSQLVKIIKYLRQEKDYALNKAEIVEADQTRLRLDLELAQKQLAEARQALDDERHKSESVLVGNAKYAEVLRKVETMNAITDSNRTLRSERDQLLTQLTQLRADVAKLEVESAPLQEQVSGLQRRCEALQGENVTLRGEATRWRQRANTLIEKTNRTSPEDWKKLQTERETLAKQLTIERANVVRLNDDLTTANKERTKLDDMVKTLRGTTAQLKDITDEMGSVKTELQQLKTDHSQLNADHITLGKDLEGKEGLLSDLRNQLAQVRKIAKKYKMQCEEMQAASAATADDATQLTERVAKLEEEMRAQQEAASAAVAQLTAKHEASLQEVDRTTQQMQASKERFAALIKNAKDRIVELTQAKNKAESDRDRLLQSASSIASGPSGDNSGATGDERSTAAEVLLEQERERHRSEVEELRERLAQLQRLLEEGGSGQQTASVGVATEQPIVAVAPHRAANIKPMMSVAHPHVASIRPHRATVTTTPSTLAVPPQQVQVQVHTTAPSTATLDNSAPTSSHEQQPQQQLPTIRVLPLVVDTSGSSTSTSTTASTSSTSSSTTTAASAVVVGVVSATAAAVTTTGVKRMRSAEDSSQSDSTTTQLQQQQQAVAGTSTSGSVVAKVQAQVQPLVKRSRMAAARPMQQLQQQQQVVEASDEGGTEGTPSVEQAEADDDTAGTGDVEYQVPTSSQRDHDDDDTAVGRGGAEGEGEDMDDDEDDEEDDDADMQVIDLVESDEDDAEDDEEDESADEDDEEDDDDDDEAEASAATAVPDDDNEEEDIEEVVDEEEAEGEVDDRGESGKRKRRRLEQEMDEEEEQDDDMVEAHGGVVDDEGDEAASAGAADAVEDTADTAEEEDGQQMEEATSSSATTSSTSGRQQTVVPMAAVSSRQHQQQQLMLPEECADDSIVPSTPTLFLPRRSGGTSGDDGVSSPHPHVPTVAQGRLFTFTDQQQQQQQQLGDGHTSSGEQEVLEQRQRLDDDDDVGGGQATGRSVPSTPHHVLHSPPASAGAAAQVEGADVEEEGATSQQVEGSEEAIVGDASATAGAEDEGREAEATPSTVAQQQQGASGVQRRSTRPVPSSSSSSSPGPVGQTGQSAAGGSSRQVTPIVWEDQQQQQQSPGQMHRTSPRQSEMLRGRGLPVQRARRSRGPMMPRGAHGFSRY